MWGKVFLLTAMLAGNGALAQPRLPLLGAGGSGTVTPPSYTGPGDVKGSWQLYCGLRGYNAAVAATGTQKAIKLERIRDATTQDILIKTDGTLDVAAAAAFAGGVDTTGTGAIVGTALTFTGGTLGDVVTGGGTLPGTFISNGASPNWTVNLSQTVASTTLTLSFGVAVDTCYDQTGNGLDMVNSGLYTTRPLLIFNALGSFPAITCTGTTLLTRASGLSGAQPFTFYGAAKRFSGTASSAILATYNSVAGSPEFGFGSASNVGYIYAGSFANGGSQTDGSFHTMQALVNGASSIVSVDGTDSSTINPGSGSLPAQVSLCSEPFVGDPLTGSVFEAGILPTTTPTERGNLNTNARAYWGY